MSWQFPWDFGGNEGLILRLPGSGVDLAPELPKQNKNQAPSATVVRIEFAKLPFRLYNNEP